MQFLLAMTKAKGGRPTQNQLHDATSFQSLSGIGIKKDQSVRLQCMALVPTYSGHATISPVIGREVVMPPKPPDKKPPEPVPRRLPRLDIKLPQRETPPPPAERRVPPPLQEPPQPPEAPRLEC